MSSIPSFYNKEKKLLFSSENIRSTLNRGYQNLHITQYFYIHFREMQYTHSGMS